MKPTVAGFKSISRVDDFDFRPLTLLGGINSSGKSSLIQALLLLKQSFEANGNEVLTIHGDYVNANQPVDLIYGKDKKRLLHYALKLD